MSTELQTELRLLLRGTTAELCCSVNIISQGWDGNSVDKAGNFMYFLLQSKNMQLVVNCQL